MKIRSIASGSSGNCYHVSDGQTPLLLEAGLPFKKIQKELGFKTSGISGVLISHEHGDHAKAVPELLRYGTDCFMSEGTADVLNVKADRRCHILEPVTHYTIGTWGLMPFLIDHDAKEPMGFRLTSWNQRLLYVTDTPYVRPRIEDLTHIMIECNYDMDILQENVKNETIPKAQKDRTLLSHMNLDNLKGFLEANDLSKVQEIWLLHLSDANSNEAEFKREIQELTGKVVKIA